MAFYDEDKLDEVYCKEESEEELKAIEASNAAKATEKKDDKKPEKKKSYDVIKTSFFIAKDEIYEQFYDNEQSGFICYNTETEQIKKVRYAFFKTEGKRPKKYIPQEGEEVEKKYVYLPTKTEEYNSDKILEKEIKAFVTKYLDIDDDHMTYVIWAIKQSWIYDRLNTINYLRALGDTGLGKTRYTKAIGALFYKPLKTTGASTAAPIFRIIDKWRGTFIFDEGDIKKSDETDTIIKIINSGFEKDNPIMRCDSNDIEKINFFDPYCPKILATRKPFEDKATESRCFTKIMQGTDRKDIPFILPDCFLKEAQVLRNKLLLWRFKNYYKIDTSIINDIDLGDLEPRVKQAHMGFLPLFANDPVKLEFFKKYLAKYQQDLIQERKDSTEGYIVNIVCEMLVAGISDISVSDIIEKGRIMDHKDRSKLMAANALSSRYLRPLGLTERKTVNVHGKSKKCIVFDLETVERIAKRYAVLLPPNFVIPETIVVDRPLGVLT